MKSKYFRTKLNLNLKTFFFLIEFRFMYLILKVWKDFCMKSDQIKIELQYEIQRALTPTKSVSPFCYTYCTYNQPHLRRKMKIWQHKKCNQYETKKYTYRIRNLSYISFCMCNSNYSIGHTLIKQSNQGSHYLVFSFHWLQITLTKLSKAMSWFDNIITTYITFYLQKIV